MSLYPQGETTWLNCVRFKEHQATIFPKIDRSASNSKLAMPVTLKQEREGGLKFTMKLATVEGEFAIRQGIKIFYCRTNYCSCK